MPREITSNKIMILTQSLAIVVACGLGGMLLESSGLLRTSLLGRMSVTRGLPVVGVAVFLVGLFVAAASALDHWSFVVRFTDTGLDIVDRLGTSHVRYDNVHALKGIPAYGAGIVLKDKNEWLDAFDGSAENRAKLEGISGVISTGFGCDIAFVNKRLGCGSKAFLEMLSAKTGLAVS